MEGYEMWIDGMDQYAAHAVAALQADRDGMPRTGDRHRAIALHLQNAQNWAMANCPAGYRVSTKWVVSFEPAVEQTYNGSRGDIYAQVAKLAKAVHLPDCNGWTDKFPKSLERCSGCAVLAPLPEKEEAAQ